MDRHPLMRILIRNKLSILMSNKIWFRILPQAKFYTFWKIWKTIQRSASLQCFTFLVSVIGVMFVCKKVYISFTFGWNGYGSGSESAKMMSIQSGSTTLFKSQAHGFAGLAAARTLEWRRCFCPRSPPSSTWRSPAPPLSSRVSLARVFIKETGSQGSNI